MTNDIAIRTAGSADLTEINALYCFDAVYLQLLLAEPLRGQGHLVGRV